MYFLFSIFLSRTLTKQLKPLKWNAFPFTKSEMLLQIVEMYLVLLNFDKIKMINYICRNEQDVTNWLHNNSHLKRDHQKIIGYLAFTLQAE